MSTDEQPVVAPKPWYKGWRGIAAGVAALVVLLFIMSPSETQLAERRAARVHAFCMERLDEKDGTDLSYVCDCVEDEAKRELLSGTKPDDLSSGWYGGVKFGCMLTATPPGLGDWLEEAEESRRETDRLLQESDELLERLRSSNPDQEAQVEEAEPQPEEVSQDVQEQIDERQRKMEESREAQRLERLRRREERLRERQRQREDDDPPNHP